MYLQQSLRTIVGQLRYQIIETAIFQHTNFVWPKEDDDDDVIQSSLPFGQIIMNFARLLLPTESSVVIVKWVTGTGVPGVTGNQSGHRIIVCAQRVLECECLGWQTHYVLQVQIIIIYAHCCWCWCHCQGGPASQLQMAIAYISELARLQELN